MGKKKTLPKTLIIFIKKILGKKYNIQNTSSGFITCNSCGELKSLENYQYRNKGDNIYHYKCKTCSSKQNKEVYDKKPKFISPEKILFNEGLKTCKTCCEIKPLEQFSKKIPTRLKISNCYKCDLKKRSEDLRKRTINNPQIKEKAKKRFQKLYYNDEEYRKRRIDRAAKYHINRCKTDEFYRFKSNIRKTVNSSFRNKGYTKNSRTHQILGEEFDVVKTYIELQFSEGMTWDNYGEWVFDHKIPMSICETVEEAIRLNHYTNFQPLWAKDNSQKRDKILPEFKHLIDEYLGDIRTRPPLLD